MPMMMDDDLDELFGDAAPIHLPPSVSKGFLQALDDLRLSGCCQKISWSKFGCIAYISPNGRNVNLRYLFCDPEDGRWKLSDQHLEDEVSTVHSDHQIAHLAWNPMGKDIAIIDVFGQISTFTNLIIMNHIHIARRCVIDPEDNLSAVVGFTWLNTERTFPLYRPAIKKDGQWQTVVSHHKMMGPHNPNPRGSAMVAVTRGGTIRLLVQGPDMRWHDTRTEIDNISSSSGLLTHAAMSADKDSTMLLVTHSKDKQLRLYRLSIDFQQMSVNIQHIKTINNCSPLDQENNGSMVNRDLACQLSHLDLIPQGLEARNRESAPPFILAAFSYVPVSHQNSSLRDEPLTIFSRWELRNAQPKLHPSFEQLTPKKANATSARELPAEIFLRRLEDVVVNRILLSLQQVCLSTVLAMTYSDGSIEFRDRGSVAILPRDEPAKQASSLPQVGLEFTDVGPCLQSALSPNACAAVSLNESQDMKLSLMQLLPTEFDSIVDSVAIEAAIEAFVIQFSAACSSQGNHHDDLLTVMQIFLQQHSGDWMEQRLYGSSLKDRFVHEIYRVLGVNIDHSVDSQSDQLFRNPNIQRCLSTQISLGYFGERKPRSLSAKVAWTILNLRFAALLMAYAFRKPGAAEPESEINKPEMIRYIVGMVSWLMSLMNFITDELFSLSRIVKDHGTMDRAFLEAQVHKMNTPALALVLISSSRAYWHYNCRYLRQLSGETKANQTHGAQRQIYRELETIFAESHITIVQFERLLTEMDSITKQAYISSQISDAERKAMESEMLVSATVPTVFVPALGGFLTVTVDKLREEIDEAELYFRDISWLGLSDHWRQEHVLDVLRKVELARGARLRRCLRCCAVMEDLPMVQGTSMWMLSMQRGCLCGGLWKLAGQAKASARGR